MLEDLEETINIICLLAIIYFVNLAFATTFTKTRTTLQFESTPSFHGSHGYRTMICFLAFTAYSEVFQKWKNSNV